MFKGLRNLVPKQLPDELTPEAAYIQEHPELRPHIWPAPALLLWSGACDWLQRLGGIVIYQCTTDPTDIRIVPRSLELQYMPGWYPPFETFSDRLAGRGEEKGRTYKIVDWVKLDTSYFEAPGLEISGRLAAEFTARKAFCLKWKDDTNLYDIYWEKRLWQPDPTQSPPWPIPKRSDVAPQT